MLPNDMSIFGNSLVQAPKFEVLETKPKNAQTKIIVFIFRVSVGERW